MFLILTFLTRVCLVEFGSEKDYRQSESSQFAGSGWVVGSNFHGHNATQKYSVIQVFVVKFGRSKFPQRFFCWNNWNNSCIKNEVSSSWWWSWRQQILFFGCDARRSRNLSQALNKPIRRHCKFSLREILVQVLCIIHFQDQKSYAIRDREWNSLHCKRDDFLVGKMTWIPWTSRKILLQAVDCLTTIWSYSVIFLGHSPASDGLPIAFGSKEAKSFLLLPPTFHHGHSGSYINKKTS